MIFYLAELSVLWSWTQSFGGIESSFAKITLSSSSGCPPPRRRRHDAGKIVAKNYDASWMSVLVSTMTGQTTKNWMVNCKISFWSLMLFCSVRSISLFDEILYFCHCWHSNLGWPWCKLQCLRLFVYSATHSQLCSFLFSLDVFM